MKTTIAAMAMFLGSGAAFAQAGPACLYSPAELDAALGHTPQAGEESTDRLGMAHCRYAMKGVSGRYFSVRVVPKCDAKRFEAHAKTMQSTSGKANQPIEGIGDGAYYSPGGMAATRVGSRCIELSGLRAGAAKPVTAAELARLLTLAASRAGTPGK